MLREAGLVEVRGDAQRRLYRVRPEPLRAVDEWLQPYRLMWAARLDDLERHLDTMTEGDTAMSPTQQETYGSADQLHDGRWQLRFTRALAHPQSKVWRAITEPEQLAQWFPTTIEGERAAGAALRFSFPNDIAPPMDGVMIAYEPESLMELAWGPDVIRIELQPVSEGTLLMLLDTLEERGKAARDGAGWHACLVSLQEALDGAHDARGHMDVWREVHPHYVESFGPEGSAIGPPEGMG